MTLQDILDKYHESLHGIYDEEEITAVFYIVVDHISGFNRSMVSLRKSEPISALNSDRYLSVLELLEKQEPLQYILSEAFFYGLKFKVNSAVLIPRQETEELVHMVINDFKSSSSHLKILDVGTGSGCIAISLKYHLPAAEIFAMDISAPALEIAAENAFSNQTTITLLNEDIRQYASSTNFNIIISNPPYITEKEGLSMDKNVMDHEPHLALFVSDNNPLEFYLAIADFAMRNLQNDGLLYFEINANFGKEVANMLTIKRFVDVHIISDMQGKDRFVKARKVA
ncbi:MAG: peptide chain release factor N(5)-glutamine methyltransferase [Pedobacter sp.]